MAAPLTGLLPETLWFQDKKQEVIAFLREQPAPSNTRREWLLLWAKWVGMRLSHIDYAKVQEGSFDV